MSEYWKSTPKYWCKYCTIYVKDTPLEKTNHEASPRHQGNLKRSLRDLHKTNEKAERDKQYAKAEAARLNGTGSASAPQPGSGDGKFKTTVNFTRSGAKPATADDRKRQMAQLAALGVAVPEDFRRDNAMVGDWQTTTQKVIWENKPDTKKEEDGDTKPQLNVGVRKRKVEEKEEEEEAVKLEEGKRRPRYGRDIRTLPDDDDDDLDALLGSTTKLTKKQKVEPKTEVSTEDDGPIVDANEDKSSASSDQGEVLDPSTNKAETSEEHISGKSPQVDATKHETEQPSADLGSIFKKRKKPAKST